MYNGLLDHKADEHFFQGVYAPIFSLRREFLMRNTKKISQWFRIVKPETMRQGQPHEPCESDEIAWAKLVMKQREKPGKFLLPHGIILLLFR
jgi:allantoicase